MFEHFTFGAQAQTDCQDYSQHSPTDTSTLITPTCSPEPSHLVLSPAMNDLVDQLGSHHFASQEQRPYLYSVPRQQFKVDDDGTFPGTKYSISNNSKVTSNTTSCRRLQRQLNVQLQSCSRHVRDINELVEQMITSNTQCTPRSYSTRPSSQHSSDFIEVDESYQEDEDEIEDEGFVDGEDSAEDEMLSLRRASAPSGVRKHGYIQWRSSAESGGQGKVWQQPRMRKRVRSRSTR
ncbi:hypothetical protein PVAG01_04734 [Phlyctema vagabunda]|uniref:Uncharacterized protein n=1 Tax=Phlyctema vagabunda TaxID=108571 RepID=A0ABR4PI14_9HELO